MQIKDVRLAENGSQWIFYAHHINQFIHIFLTIKLAAAIAPILMKENDILDACLDCRPYCYGMVV